MVKVDFSNSAQARKNIMNKFEKRLIAYGYELANDVKMSMRADGPSLPGQPPAVVTGRLRASISVNWSGSGNDRATTSEPAVSGDGVGQPPIQEGKFKVVVGTNVPYGELLENGTPRLQPRPFLRPALDRLKVRLGV